MSNEIKVPEMGESVLEATVARWLKQAGDSVAAGEAVVELETDKVALEVSAQQNGVLLQILKQPGDSVMVGDTLALVGSAGAPEPRPATAAATPVAQRMAQDLGINLAQVQPGAAGKITKEDLQAYIEKTSSNVTKTANPPEAVSSAPQQTSPAQQPVQSPPASVLEQPGREKRIRMTRRRQTIARRLVEAQHTAAMLTTFNEVDMSAIIDIRKRRREGFKERYGVDLGFMPFFVKASIGALQAYPYLNAEISSSPLGDEIVLKSFYDIGIAIGAEEGLVVPVLRDADRMSFAAIEKAIREYAARAKEGALTLEDLRGGTFTITNGGVFGSLLSTPILNPPQVAILGMHKIQERPVVVKGEIVIRPMMYLAVSYDHRIVDGREAVQFLARIKELVEDPEALLLG